MVKKLEKLEKLVIVPDKKVHKGLKPLPGGHNVETFCSGLDGVVERASDYYAQGASSLNGEQFLNNIKCLSFKIVH